MKAEVTDVDETRKHLSVEVPPDVVDGAIEKVARQYSRTARVPGFRPGKVPATVVRQRYKDQILYDVAQELIPRVVAEALRERGLRPVAAPDIRDVVIEEGRPLTFLADFETLPPIEPGDYAGISLRKPPAVLEVGAIEQTLEQLRQGAAKWHPVEDRPSAIGDVLLADLTRTRRTSVIEIPGEGPARGSAGDTPERLEGVTIELGHAGNPPGFDDHLTGSVANDTRAFTVRYPQTYEVAEMAGATVDYDVTVKGIRRKELLALDDELAKEVSDVDTLDALRERIKHDLQHRAEHEADHQVRHDLLQELGARMRAQVPAVLVDEEIDRRLEELVRRLMEQGVDPMKADIDWKEFRERQRGPAEQTVKSTLVLDEISRREHLDATDDEVKAEIEKFAERAGRTPAAVRARLEKEGGLDRVRSGIRREKTMSWLIDKANITQ